MAVGRSTQQGRSLVRGHRPALRLQHLDLAGFDQLPERGTLQGVVGDLAPAGEPEEQGLAAGQ
jgi:hypothetical protein